MALRNWDVRNGNVLSLWYETVRATNKQYTVIHILTIGLGYGLVVASR